jgi:hypothetical protein
MQAKVAVPRVREGSLALYKKLGMRLERSLGIPCKEGAAGASVVRVCACVVAPLCKGQSRSAGAALPRDRAAARQRAPLARMHSKLHQPPTTPCLYLASPAWCTSHFVVV